VLVVPGTKVAPHDCAATSRVGIRSLVISVRTNPAAALIGAKTTLAMNAACIMNNRIRSFAPGTVLFLAVGLRRIFVTPIHGAICTVISCTLSNFTR
jgi:hypothetical protein